MVDAGRTVTVPVSGESSFRDAQASSPPPSSLTVLMARCHVLWAVRYEPLLADTLEGRYRAQGVL